MPTSRSPELMSALDTALLVVDMQEKLLPAIDDHKRILWNTGRLIDGANILNVAVVATEQYPQGLGPTMPELVKRLGQAPEKLAAKKQLPEKLAFSCRGVDNLFEDIAQRGIAKLLIAGIEAHVCVQQTALDALAAGFRVYIAVDAVGSRNTTDREIALRRMDSSGATLTTTEAVLFEWCEIAGTPEFKQISQLVRQVDP